MVANPSGIVMSIVMIAMVLAVSLYVLATVQSSLPADGTAYNATGNMISKLADIPTWIGILIVAGMGGIALMWFLGVFGARR